MAVVAAGAANVKFPLPPRAPAMALEQIHLWYADLDALAGQSAPWLELLCPEERQRAQQLLREPARGRFIARRAVLRQLLGQYLDLPPGKVPLQQLTHGKPALADELGSDLQFNLAHSGALALFAVARARIVGVDLEQLRPDIDAAAISKQYFAAEEKAQLEEQPESGRLSAFFRLWTLKEAYLKATGSGFFLASDAFALQLDPPALIRSPAAADEPARWSFASLTPQPGYLAALAVAGAGWEICLWPWRGGGRP